MACDISQGMSAVRESNVVDGREFPALGPEAGANFSLALADGKGGW